MNGLNKLLVAVVLLVAGCTNRNTETTASSFDTVASAPKEAAPSLPVKQEIDPDSIPSQRLGEMILAGEYIPTDNPATFRLFDSLNAESKTSRQFYFTVFNKIMDRADGALSEAIGDYAVTYVEQNPKAFVENIMKLPAERLETWAGHVGIELFLAAGEPKTAYQTYTEAVAANCKKCDRATTQKLQQFNKLVWQTMQENIKGDTTGSVQ